MFLPSNSKWTHIFLQTVHFHAFKHLFVFDVLGIKSEFMEAANLCICFIYILDAGFGVWVYWFESMHQLWTDVTEQMNRRVLSWMEELQNKSSHFCVSSVLLLGFSRSLRGRTEKLLALKQTFQLIKYSFNSNVFLFCWAETKVCRVVSHSYPQRPLLSARTVPGWRTRRSDNICQLMNLVWVITR